MTSEEFQDWFGPKKLREALAVALDVIRQQKDGYLGAVAGNWIPDAEDIVQVAAVRAYKACARLVVDLPDDPQPKVMAAWPFLVGAIEGAAANLARGRARERRAKKAAAGALGPGSTARGDYGDSGRYAGKIGLGLYDVYPLGHCKPHGGAYEKVTIEVGRDRLQRKNGPSRKTRAPRYEVVVRQVVACANGGRKYGPLTLEPGPDYATKRGPNAMTVVVDRDLARCLGVAS